VRVIFNNYTKVSSLKERTRQLRLRSALSPLLFGIGVSLDHMFGSRSMLDMLSRLGFSASYDEVNHYKQCVVQCDTEELPNLYPSHFTQWSGDNMDLNLCTLDGQNTFHGMGIVSMSTPCSSGMTGSCTQAAEIPRVQRLQVVRVVREKGIPQLVLSCSLPEKSALSALRPKPVSVLQFTSPSQAPVL